MKTVLLSVLLLILPTCLADLKKDNLVVFSSLSYYGCDFDGDKLTDLAAWNPRTNTLYFQLTSNNKFYEKKFFDTNIQYDPVFADYDGDGKTDFTFFHKDSGQWSISSTLDQNFTKNIFLGNIGDLPIPASIDDDAKYEPTVWRPINAAWLLAKKDDEGNYTREVIFDGSYQDSVFSGDYDGDGKSDLINWRPDDGYWHIVKSGTNFDFNQSEHIQHGKEWDTIVPNDYDGDGKCDLVLWRKSNQTWYFKYAKDGSQSELKFGGIDDIPASGDIDGDGFPELIMWNPGEKKWNILNFKTQQVFSYKWDVPSGCLPAISVLQKFE